MQQHTNYTNIELIDCNLHLLNLITSDFWVWGSLCAAPSASLAQAPRAVL